MRTSLALAILLWMAPEAHAASIKFFGVAFARRHIQNSTAAPPVAGTQAYEARAFVYATTTTTASVKKPNNSTVNLADVGNHLEAKAVYDSEFTFKNAWPAGSYTISMANPSDGSKASTMQLSGDLYPIPARVSNFVDAQAMTPGQNFALTWDPLGRPAGDLVDVKLEENGAVVFETPAYLGIPGALNGTSTSVIIPSDRLIEGRVYTCTISVWRAVIKDSNTIPGALGETAYIAKTTVTLRTRFALQDVRHYGVEKRINYEQTTATPTFRSSPWEMYAFASAITADSLTSATFRSPAGAVNGLVQTGVDFGYSQAFVNQSALDAAFASGAYEVRLNTKNNGLRVNSQNLNGNYPAAPPQISNIDEAQYIKTASPFTLLWNLPDGVANDHVQLTIMDGASAVVSTPIVPGTPGALNGSIRSFPFAAGIFTAGKSYTGILRHCRPTAVDSFTYPTAVGMWGHARITRFQLQTASGPTPKPLLSSLARIGNQTELSFSTVRGEKYQVLSSPLELKTWTAAPKFTANGPNTVLRLPIDPTPSGYYQIMVAP